MTEAPDFETIVNEWPYGPDHRLIKENIGTVVHIFGRPNSGKTTLRNMLADRHPDFKSFCIDDFRRKYGDGTAYGETRAQTFFRMVKYNGSGFYESSGMGFVTEMTLYDLRNANSFVIVLDTSDEICIDRINPYKYDGIPFPFSKNPERYILRTGEFLNSREFRMMCEGSKVLWVDGKLPRYEQVDLVERFVGLSKE